MKLLVVQKVAGVAGSEKYLLNLLPSLVARGINSSFLLLHEDHVNEKVLAFEEELVSKGVDVNRIKVNSIPRPLQLLSIHRLIKKKGYTLIHTNLIYADMTLAIVKCFLNRKMKLVSGKHGYEEWYNNRFGFDSSKKVKNIYWRIAKWSERYIDRSFAISRGLYDLYLGLGICKEEKLEIIKYGFRFDSDYQYNESFRKGSPQLVIVGRLTEFKGHRFALQSLVLLKKKFPDIQLGIVGWGHLETDLKQMVVELGLTSNVFFTGFQKRPRDWMFSSDVVLLPSVSEGMGIVILEAMSCERPVVAFNVPSPSEVFEHRKDALLAKPYSIEEYASLIEEILIDGELRTEIVSRAYKKLINEYGLDRMTEEKIAFYKSVLCG